MFMSDTATYLYLVVAVVVTEGDITVPADHV